MSARWGLTLPRPGVGLLDHADLVRGLPALGYTDVWSSETNGADAHAARPGLGVGTAIVPFFTGGPALIAISAAALADAAPGLFVLGLGASSPVIVGGWNGVDFDEPFRRSRDVLPVVRAALNGELVDGTFDSFSIKRFRWTQISEQIPKVILAALRPEMLALAGREADGAILNWLASCEVPQCVDAVANDQAEIIARIFVCPTEDDDFARAAARRFIASYLTVPAYAAFHEWLGRGRRWPRCGKPGRPAIGLERWPPSRTTWPRISFSTVHPPTCGSRSMNTSRPAWTPPCCRCSRHRRRRRGTG